MKNSILAVLMMMALAASAYCDTVYVNNIAGSDSFDGRSPVRSSDGRSGPCATIMEGVRKAGVGDVVSIARTGGDYLESVNVQGFNKGTPARPLVLDGNGATVSGLLRIGSERWHHLRADIYWMENKPGHNELSGMPNSNWLSHLRHQGWFEEAQAPRIFFLDGKQAPYTSSLETIPVGGFFYDTQGDPRRIYVRLPAGKRIDEVKIEFPQNLGVRISDDYTVVRNMKSIYSIDDGFSGFSGFGIVFENVNGSFNCDQGISFHHESVVMVDGGLFEHNGGCGIVDVHNSTTTYRNVTVRDNMIGGAMMMGLSHKFLGCRFYGNQGDQVSGTGGAGACSVLLKDCNIDGGGGVGVSGEKVRADGGTMVNCRGK